MSAIDPDILRMVARVEKKIRRENGCRLEIVAPDKKQMIVALSQVLEVLLESESPEL
jgi:hypothetical protein